MNNTVYIAGKITGDSDYKHKFAEAEARLQQAGYIVVNPATLPSTGFSWDAYMRMSGAMLQECEAICLLPDWKDGRGAMLEYECAITLGKKVLYYDDLEAEGV